MRKTKAKLLLVVAVLIGLTVVFGQAKAVTLVNPLEYDTIEELIEHIVNFIFYIAVALVPLMIVIAAFYFVTAAGDTQKIQMAKTIILYTIIGLCIILLARGIVYAIKFIIGAP